MTQYYEALRSTTWRAHLSTKHYEVLRSTSKYFEVLQSTSKYYKVLRSELPLSPPTCFFLGESMKICWTSSRKKKRSTMVR